MVVPGTWCIALSQIIHPRKYIMKSSLILLPLWLIIALFTNMCGQSVNDSLSRDNNLVIKKTGDFDITGDGSSGNWEETEWVQLSQLNNHDKISYTTRLKILYSDTGMYFFFENEDAVLTATMDENFMELWHEDVVEIFLRPYEEVPVAYFEYELSPLNYELPLLISNDDGNLAHWQPYHNSYQGDRKVRHYTSVSGGVKESGASVDQWMAEIFIPFDLLRPLKNISPESGTRWKANFYRIDYDNGQTLYAWQPIDRSFHEYEKFGTIIFE